MNPKTHYQQEARYALGLEAVEHLREAGLQLEYLHGKYQPTSSGEAVISRINGFLSRFDALTDSPAPETIAKSGSLPPDSAPGVAGTTKEA